MEGCWLDGGGLVGWKDVGWMRNGCMNGGESQQKQGPKHTSMACVYCSSRSSILEIGRAGWDFFTLLLEGRRRSCPMTLASLLHSTLSLHQSPLSLPELHPLGSSLIPLWENPES